jgi:23S rRNA (uracil1939-C5)-methyltransferase
VAEEEPIEIDAVGAQADGIGGPAGRRTFVPFALPGERWARADGAFSRTGPVSPDRRQPPCLHFGTCGGCVAQHMSPGFYARWKRQILVDALDRAGIAAEVAPLRTVPPASRRRVVLSARWLPAGVALGFHERASERLLAITQCDVADPLIVESLPALRQVAARLLSRRDEMRMTVTRVDAGLDVAVEGGKSSLDAADRAALAALIAPTRILRLSMAGDPVVSRAAPLLTIGPAKVVPPPGIFLQAAAVAEQTMIDLVIAGVGKARSIADLFSGIGTFSLPLARRARVLAIDTEQAALAALDAAARNTQGLKPIETRTRDLMREPLSRKELEPFDAVVIDPPRAGAEAQAAMLANSRVATVVAVSCNPTTLARDSRILLDGGYTLQSITPIDQFLYSHHLEAVAVLTRGPARARKRA